jgi:hypothetical protein
MAAGGDRMSHAVMIPDDLYRVIEAYAAGRGESAEAVILAWARGLGEQHEQRGQAPVEEDDTFVYNPADDPLAAFLGKGELTSADAIRRHDEAVAWEALDAHEE